MVRLEIPSEQDGWLHQIGAKEVYEQADLPTSESGELSDSGNVQLADGEMSLEEFEAWLDEIHANFVTAEDTSKQLTTFNESELPEMVLARMREAVMGGALFSDIESIPSGARSDLQAFLMDELSDDGWSLDSMSEEISDLFEVSEDRAELIARSETQSIVNEAAEGAYHEMEQERGEEFRYKWVGTYDDGRTTKACQWLLEQTNPKHGGDPVTLERLKELIQEAPEHDPDLDDNMAREWAAHPGCRKRYVRHVE